ncbi:MAG: hypothetical protein WBL15_14200 [Phycisphaerae bacterium]|jgi:hypothetical protein|nr:HNH endonuclease [Phycisphaerae bacterium]HOJ54352.1 HNH endonuclease [Phycisphaerae bacterium]HOL26823.1 HNH endonuclease [Phycisphaerae bacterium]HPP19984.1 HNH endonuclease [Phycisphaerae bacterium]
MDDTKTMANTTNSGGRKTRLRLVRMFSANLAIYFPEYSNHFVCPLCKRVIEFKKPEDANGWVSLAHFVPKSVGGKHVVLTCAECNNFFGSKIDSAYAHALAYHRWLAGQRALPARMSLGEASLGVEMTKTGSNWHFRVIARRTNPAHEKCALEYICRSAGKFEGELTFRFYNPSALGAEMIHSAVLTLFQSFGYEYALCPNADKMRAILRGKLSDPVVQKAVISLESNPELPVGTVAVLTRPKRFRCFVVFLPPLTGDKSGFVVMMPGFRKEDWPPYRRFIREVNETLTFSYRVIPTLSAAELQQPEKRGFGHWAWLRAYEEAVGAE